MSHDGRPAAAVLGLALLAAGGCAHHPALSAVPPDGGGWRELRTQRFELRTDLPAAEARALLAELEAIHEGLRLALFGGREPDVPMTIRVVAFRSREEIGLFLPPGGAAMANLLGARLLLVVPGYLRELQRAVVAHELTHALTAADLARQPPWFREGIACYAETIDWTGPGKNVTLGRVPPWRSLTGRAREIRQALEAKRISRLSYSAAWALVHYLLNRRPAELADLQDRFARGEAPDAAWRAVFPEWDPDAFFSTSKLEAEMSRYFTGKTPAYVYRHQWPAEPPAIRERALAPWEVHDVRLGLPWLNRGRRLPRKAFDAELAAGLAAGSIEAAALAAARRPAEAVALAERMTREHPESAAAWLLLARVASEPERKEASLRRAAELEPSSADARHALARHLLDAKRAPEALPHANEAVRLAPWSPAVLDTLAGVAEALGRCADALAVQRRAVDNVPEWVSEDERKPYAERLSRLEGRCAEGSRSAW